MSKRLSDVDLAGWICEALDPDHMLRVGERVARSPQLQERERALRAEILADLAELKAEAPAHGL